MIDKIAVVAGTNVDTQMGCDLLQSIGYDTLFMPISSDCDEQAGLQYYSREKLQELFDDTCDRGKKQGAKKIFLYCNSLSSAIDYESTSKKYDIDIITPLESYKKLPQDSKNIVILSANGVSAYNIDNIVNRYNKGINTISIGNMSIVQMIEISKNPKDIIDDLNILGLMSYFENIKSDKYKIDTIILGCTHFPYIKEELKKVTGLKIIDPTNDMIERLKQKNK